MEPTVSTQTRRMMRLARRSSGVTWRKRGARRLVAAFGCCDDWDGRSAVGGAHRPFGVGLLEGFHLAGKGFEGADAEHGPSHLRHAKFSQCAFGGRLETLGLGEGGIGVGIGGSHELPHGGGMGIGGRTAEGGHDVFKQCGLRRVELQRGQGVVVMVHKQGVETQR